MIYRTGRFIFERDGDFTQVRLHPTGKQVSGTLVQLLYRFEDQTMVVWQTGMPLSDFVLKYLRNYKER